MDYLYITMHRNELFEEAHELVQQGKTASRIFAMSKNQGEEKVVVDIAKSEVQSPPQQTGSEGGKEQTKDQTPRRPSRLLKAAESSDSTTDKVTKAAEENKKDTMKATQAAMKTKKSFLEVSSSARQLLSSIDEVEEWSWLKGSDGIIEPLRSKLSELIDGITTFSSTFIDLGPKEARNLDEAKFLQNLRLFASELDPKVAAAKKATNIIKTMHSARKAAM